MAKKKETVFQRKNAVHSIAGQVHQVSIRKALQEGDEVAFPWALLLQSTRGGDYRSDKLIVQAPLKSIHDSPHTRQ